jgi:transposase
VEERIEAQIAPFAPQVTQLDEIPGINRISAWELIAEIGIDATRFPTAAHLVSWAKFAPIEHQSAGRGKPSSTGKGNPWLAATLGEIVVSLSRTPTFLGERYRRLSRRRGKARALVAVGNSVLTVIWHLLANPDTRFTDLGPDFSHSMINPDRCRRDLIRQLQALTGQRVTLHPAA